MKDAEGDKKFMKTITQDATDLCDVITTEDEWSWAKAKEIQEPLLEARRAVATLKSPSQLWKDWAVQDNWSTWVRKERIVQSEFVMFLRSCGWVGEGGAELGWKHSFRAL